MTDKEKLEYSNTGWPCKTNDYGSIGTVSPTVWGETLWFVSSEGKGEGPCQPDEVTLY